jgi:uncharacterized protein YqgV (UPF0045/DUF77 family)
MMIAIQVSLYPIGEKDIDEKLNIFWEALKAENINFKITPLSTITWSVEEEKLYNSVFKAYKKVRKICPAVMVSTITTGDESDIENLLKFLK